MEIIEAAPATTVALPHYRFTVEQYARIVNEGILPEDVRVELIEGEIIAMSPIGPPHVNSVAVLTELLFATKPADVVVFVQSPINLPNRTQPQPDLALVRRRNYARALPTGADVLVVIEVADSTRDSDRRVKLPLYAAAGIPEAWLVDLVDHRIERHTDPGPKGYETTITRREGAMLESVVVPGVRVSVDAVLGVGQ